ncbi:MAG: hypothetical protein IPI61_00665 [Syntrophaceae bacterium]|nr:hypothetical protein [Syntrophaceae bacterium]
MAQDVAMVYMHEDMPCPRYFNSADLRSLVGEEHCPASDLIVLEKSDDAVIVITNQGDSPCIGELGRAILKGKKISVRVTEEKELRRLFVRICDFFDLAGKPERTRGKQGR